MTAFPTLSTIARAGLLALALGVILPSAAVPLTDLSADTLVPMAADVRTMLNLTPNQHTLWMQAEAKTHTLLRERRRRREALQDKTKALLARPDAELRELDRQAAAEDSITGAENAQLRTLWLDVNDALDDNQRRQVAGMLAEQLMRVVPEGGRPGRAEHGGERGGQRGGRGMGHGRGGPGGGPGGGTLNIGG